MELQTVSILERERFMFVCVAERHISVNLKHDMKESLKATDVWESFGAWNLLWQTPLKQSAWMFCCRIKRQSFAPRDVMIPWISVRKANCWAGRNAVWKATIQEAALKFACYKENYCCCLISATKFVHPTDTSIEKSHNVSS